MRKTRGLLFILVGVALATLSGYMVNVIARQAAAKPPAAVVVSLPTPIPKVYVVVAAKDLADNVAISSGDVAVKELPADLAPPGAIASADIATGKYTTARIYRGEIIVAPLLAETQRSGALASEVPEGKVAMAVVVNDAMNSLGALRPGDHVDVLLSLDVRALAPATNAPNLPPGESSDSQPDLSTQLTMQNVEILAIGAPAGDQPATNPAGTAARPQQPSTQQARTITFLLDHQDAVTLKFIKDSGGTIDLVVRSPDDRELAKTDAVTLDTIYRKYSFRFVQPVTR